MHTSALATQDNVMGDGSSLMQIDESDWWVLSSIRCPMPSLYWLMRQYGYMASPSNYNFCNIYKIHKYLIQARE